MVDGIYQPKSYIANHNPTYTHRHFQFLSIYILFTISEGKQKVFTQNFFNYDELPHTGSMGAECSRFNQNGVFDGSTCARIFIVFCRPHETIVVEAMRVLANTRFYRDRFKRNCTLLMIGCRWKGKTIFSEDIYYVETSRFSGIIFLYRRIFLVLLDLLYEGDIDGQCWDLEISFAWSRYPFDLQLVTNKLNELVIYSNWCCQTTSSTHIERLQCASIQFCGMRWLSI